MGPRVMIEPESRAQNDALWEDQAHASRARDTRSPLLP